jgi:hypothetical protein
VTGARAPQEERASAGSPGEAVAEPTAEEVDRALRRLAVLTGRRARRSRGAAPTRPC